MSVAAASRGLTAREATGPSAAPACRRRPRHVESLATRDARHRAALTADHGLLLAEAERLHRLVEILRVENARLRRELAEARG